MRILTFFRFVLYFSNIFGISFIFTTLGICNMCHSLSRSMGTSALKTVRKNIENSRRNWQIDLKNKNLGITFFVNISIHIQYFRKRIFAIANRLEFLMKRNIIKKNSCYFLIHLYIFAWFLLYVMGNNSEYCTEVVLLYAANPFIWHGLKIF